MIHKNAKFNEKDKHEFTWIEMCAGDVGITRTYLSDKVAVVGFLNNKNAMVGNDLSKLKPEAIITFANIESVQALLDIILPIKEQFKTKR